jgi:hypothetical protein
MKLPGAATITQAITSTTPVRITVPKTAPPTRPALLGIAVSGAKKEEPSTQSSQRRHRRTTTDAIHRARRALVFSSSE